MPVIFAGPGGSVSISTPHLFQKVRGLGKVIQAGAVQGALRTARLQRDIYRDGLRANSLGLRPLAASTITARITGKDAGRTPARPPTRRTQPLYYSSQMAKGLQVKLRSKAIIELQHQAATVSYSGGRHPEIVALQEKGFVRRGRFTPRMLAYLHILFRKDAARGRRAREDQARRARSSPARAGVGYSSKVPPRPAIATARIRGLRRLNQFLQSEITTAVRKSGLKTKRL